MVRIDLDKATDTFRCLFVNNGTLQLIPRSPDSAFLAGLTALEAKIGAVTGAPAIVSSIPELY